MRTQNSRLTAKSGGTALREFLGGVGWTTALALIAIVAMIAVAAGCAAGTSEEEDDYEPSRSYQAEPTATALTIMGSSPTAAPRYDAMEDAMDDSDDDYWYSSNRSRLATPVPARPAPSRERTPIVPGGPITFNDYLQSGWVWADQDNMSTFSLDTDRTSFALALNWAQSGYEIDPDSVRAEEWINAFNYDYPQPSHDDSFGITTDVFEHPLDSAFQMVRLGFQAPRVEDNIPVNVTLVLDASGSMADGNRIEIAQEAAETIRNSLSSRDRIAVVQFSTDVINNLTVEHTDPDDRDVRRSIDRLTPNASTNVQAGLNEGVWLADRARRDRPNAYNYIILMSDGVANVDATDPFAILESAYDRNAGNPLRLITIGVGISNYNDVLLEQLAQHGNGWYRYLNDTDHARQTFTHNNWLAISKPFADQTRAQVMWNPDVVNSWRMVGYENRVTSDQSFTENRKEFAEIPAGAATTVFFEVRLRDDMRGRLNSVADLGTVDLRWVDPVTGQSLQQSQWMDVQVDRRLGRGGDAYIEFGSIVALSADRYASLPNTDSYGAEIVHHELSVLSDRLESLDGELGRLESFRDFRYVLSHMMRDLPEAPARPSSGYSN
ncbi:MAG: DUF3520 domain-containing protein [Dehalococcoidia bacterium]|nr:DUF3520 domain-containing protein [Dehalococcoidia bacterium]